MKKFIALALGLVLVGTVVMVNTDASRDAYHTHLYQQALKRRGTRRFTAAQRIRENKMTAQDERTTRKLSRNLRYSKSKRNLFGGKESNPNLKFRPMSKTIGFATARSARETLRLKNLDPMYVLTDTVVTEDFSVEIPRGWKPNVKEGSLRIGDNKTFSITIERQENACDNVSFQACALALSKDLNHLENIGTKINSLGKVTRLYQETDRILGTNEYTKTLTESFVGTYFGRDVFVTRYFVQEPGTKNVFVLETIVNKNMASEAVVVAKRMEKSFRMIAD